MANDNISALEELRELVKLAEGFESITNDLAFVSLGDVPVFDTNGEKIADYRYVGDIGWTFVFVGQEYSDDAA